MKKHTYNPINVPTQYQLPVNNDFKDIIQITFKRSLQQFEGHIKATSRCCIPTFDNYVKYQLPTPYGFPDIAQARI